MTCACVLANSLRSCSTLCDPVDCSPPGSSVNQFSRQECWSGLPCPTPRDLPDSGIEPVSLMFLALASGFFTTSATWEALFIVYVSQSQFSSSFHSPSHLDIHKLVLYIFVYISVLQVSSSVPLF